MSGNSEKIQFSKWINRLRKWFDQHVRMTQTLLARDPIKWRRCGITIVAKELNAVSQSENAKNLCSLVEPNTSLQVRFRRYIVIKSRLVGLIKRGRYSPSKTRQVRFNLGRDFATLIKRNGPIKERQKVFVWLSIVVCNKGGFHLCLCPIVSLSSSSSSFFFCAATPLPLLHDSLSPRSLSNPRFSPGVPCHAGKVYRHC